MKQLEEPPYRLEVYKKIRGCIERFEPLVITGMHDVGHAYLFNMVVKDLKSKKINNSIIIDLTGCNGNFEKEAKVIESAFGVKNSVNQFSEIFNKLSSIKFCLIINLHECKEVSDEFLELISKLRNYFTMDFSYIIFCCTNFAYKYKRDQVGHKIFNRNILPYLPLNNENSLTYLDKLQIEYNKKITKIQINSIIQHGGGSCGLIKCLYFQAQADKNWILPDYKDPDLLFRLKRVIDFMSETESADLNTTVNLKVILSEVRINKLKRFGYLNQNGQILSPVFIHSFKSKTYQSTDSQNIAFSPAQRKVFKIFKKSSGSIITKDAIAETIWGNKWIDKYSDWAIDQMIHEIREKLELYDLGKIITKKGEGYIFIK